MLGLFLIKKFIQSIIGKFIIGGLTVSVSLILVIIFQPQLLAL